MALFRKFFYRKPPEGLLEISERVYVFDCCFTTEILDDGEYRVYMEGIVRQLRDHFPDASFMVFNFREGESQSQIANILSDYDMTVMDYPRHYESCPILTMEMIHHFLRSGESWLLLGQQNVLLMHCERGGWPVLAFMVAALLIYRKQYTAEQKTLDMIYKQAPRELLQLMSPLNPLPSQLRYLQYVSRRNVGSEWPPLDRALTLDCIILRVIPAVDGERGCRPMFRIYGQDPFMVADSSPKVLFSTPKKSKIVRHYKQADCELVKIDIHCHVLGDVVLECISLGDDQERELMMFRVMFNTAFIRSNILMLNRDEVDILWNAKDQFPKDFRAEVLFSETNAATSLVTIDLPGLEEKEGLPVEAFAKVQEIFSNVDWQDSKADLALNVLQHVAASNILQEKLETLSSQDAGAGKDLLDTTLGKFKEEPNSKVFEENPQNSTPVIQENEFVAPSEASLSVNSTKWKIEPQELQVPVQRPAQIKIISPRKVYSSLSSPASYSNSMQGSPVSISRYHSAPSALGITALLHDHATPAGEEVARLVSTASPASPSASAPTSSYVNKSEAKVLSIHPQPPPPPSLQHLTEEPALLGENFAPPSPPRLASPIPHIELPSKSSHSSLSQQCSPSRNESSFPLPPQPLQSPHSFMGESLSPRKKSSAVPPAQTVTPPSTVTAPSSTISDSSLPSPPPPPSHSSSVCPPPPPPPPRHSSSVCPPPPPPSPPRRSSSVCPPPPPHSLTPPASRLTVKSSTAGPPPPPPLGGITKDPASQNIPNAPPPPRFSSSVSPPPPPPHPLQTHPVSGLVVAAPSTAPPPPPPPGVRPNIPASKSSPNAPPVPPPPAPPATRLPKAGIASQHSHAAGTNGNVPPFPGPPASTPLSAKGRGLPRASPRNYSQTKKTSLKPYHWLKLTRAMQGSLWAETQKMDEASKTPEFDMSELESLFSASAPNSDHATGGKSSRRRTGPKSDKVHLIELRRAYNCEIMLSKVKIPLSDLMNSVLVLDDSALDVDQVDNLIKFCPTKEEMELLKGYNGDKENLGKCEQFFLELIKVPRVESKLRVFSFKMQFHHQVSDLRHNLNVINSVAEEIRNSAKLKRIMQTILSLGNALNHGTARGSAIGFRLDSLLKLTDTRARNNKMTLMHYLCKVLAEKLPELLDFPKDLVSLEASTKIQLKYLAEEMQAISKGLEKVIQELAASESDGPVSETFCKNLKKFLGFAEAEVRSLASLYSAVGRNADELAHYFGEDPARCPFEQVVSTLLNFVRMFLKANEENRKQLEFEKKKAQKEAKNVKTKMG